MCDKMISFYFLSKSDGNGDRPFSMGYPTKPDQIWIRPSGGRGTLLRPLSEEQMEKQHYYHVGLRTHGIGPAFVSSIGMMNVGSIPILLLIIPLLFLLSWLKRKGPLLPEGKCSKRIGTGWSGNKTKCVSWFFAR